MYNYNIVFYRVVQLIFLRVLLKLILFDFGQLIN